MRVALAMALLLLAATPALAAGGEESESLLFPTLNFLLLLAALVYFVRKPAVEFFANRRSDIQRELASAEEQKREAEERYAKWQRKLVDLERELDEIRTTSRERAETEREHILADAHAAAERIRRAATLAVDRELLRAREQLRAEASDLAVELAGGLLRDQVDDDDRTRLVDEFITRIERADATGVDGGDRS